MRSESGQAGLVVYGSFVRVSDGHHVPSEEAVRVLHLEQEQRHARPCVVDDAQLLLRLACFFIVDRLWRRRPHHRTYL